MNDRMKYVQSLSAAEAAAFERIRQREGTLMTTVDGNRISITVKLRKSWALVTSWTPTPRQIERLLRAASITDLWLRVAVLVGVAWILLEVAIAFLPGGAVDRVLGGGR
jgi:hypothetical protein